MQEGLDFLGARKEFWQQQKPVYARRNEALAKKRAIYHHEKPKTSATVAVAIATKLFKKPVVKPKHSLSAVGNTTIAALEIASVDRQESVAEN